MNSGIKQFFIFCRFIFGGKGLPANDETVKKTEAEIEESEPGLKFKPRLKYGWLHLKSY